MADGHSGSFQLFIQTELDGKKNIRLKIFMILKNVNAVIRLHFKNLIGC